MGEQFQELYRAVVETSENPEDVILENDKVFTVLLDEFYSIRVFDCQTRVYIEILDGKKCLTYFFTNEENACVFLSDVLSDRDGFIKKLGGTGMQRIKIFLYLIGGILMFFSALLTVSIWSSLGSDTETPLYVYFVLTACFGAVFLMGLGLVLMGKKRILKRNVNARDLICYRWEFPMESIEYILPKQLGFMAPGEREEMQHYILALQGCAEEWYRKNMQKSGGTLLAKRKNKYIGNVSWNVGKTSFLFLSDGTTQIRFVLDTPSDIKSPEYQRAQQIWNEMLAKVQKAGWLVYNVNS